MKLRSRPHQRPAVAPSDPQASIWPGLALALFCVLTLNAVSAAQDEPSPTPKAPVPSSPKGDKAAPEGVKDGEGKIATPPEDPRAAELRREIENQCKAISTEDMKLYSEGWHSKAEGRGEAIEIMAEILAAYDLSSELLRSRFFGGDADYLAMRACVLTRRRAGGPFTDNEVETLFIFKRDGERWKIYSSLNLEIRFLRGDDEK